MSIASAGLAYYGRQPESESHGCKNVSFENPQKKMLKMLREGLGLNEEQTKKIEGLALAHKKEMIQLGASGQGVRIELFESLMEPEAELTTRMQRCHIQLVLGIKAILTKDQLKKFSEMMPLGFMGKDHESPGQGPMQPGRY